MVNYQGLKLKKLASQGDKFLGYFARIKSAIFAQSQCFL